MTLNLSKSFKDSLLALTTNFLAREVFSHLPSKSKALTAFLQRGHTSWSLLEGTGSSRSEHGDSKSGQSKSPEGVKATGDSAGGSFN